MKIIVLFFLLFFATPFFLQAGGGNELPLLAYSKKWANPKYKVCNTAANAGYMSDEERKVVYILNLVRMDPKLFCETVVMQAATISSFIDTSSALYFKTLVTTLNNMESLPVLYPDSACVVSARCHAVSSGKKGYTGHARQNDQCRKNTHFMGECCNYGSDDALEILLLLLDDNGVASLGHRRICLGSYSKVGVAIAPHKSFAHNAVLDFY